MDEGDLVLASLPQADGQRKNRPAVIVRELPPFRDLLVCGVSTQVQHAGPGFDEVVSPADPDYAGSGLRAGSVIRLGFLASVPRTQILGSIGAVHPTRHARLLRNLSEHLLAKTT
ncbi:MAG: transcriptional regulator [Armatimonadetes bacterium CG_4_10_14_3_um_filter_66_18]|nr:type II toxin-antitoxin system PemK/MazF family toxin [Armatimonadota bacterium]OIP09257.1 MAG: transcriptional regulator [Armatimonadetes bacterium CG2_30_66_41]PIX46844.1 MAG: transcriptional regulator [Armatimonadetes bacterium CG_4_8_14_3_um_filter_66_20]PIY51831.1 MAG: transcriptional regulator [Armatimonadetes bacterium CG_4_10_14_3_um_filter_66_18]PIZ42463.1 MAG: transcriptional regulator [Armatimonadetes bacterium CG_4_10_14_0_8_um_filter_66_14]PJB71929.1 MAG: transcriptional regula